MYHYFSTLHSITVITSMLTDHDLTFLHTYVKIFSLKLASKQKIVSIAVLCCAFDLRDCMKLATWLYSSIAMYSTIISCLAHQLNVRKENMEATDSAADYGPSFSPTCLHGSSHWAASTFHMHELNFLFPRMCVGGDRELGSQGQFSQDISTKDVCGRGPWIRVTRSIFTRYQ